MSADVLLLYDADCGFCRWSVAALLALDRRARVHPLTIQSEEGRRLLADLPPEEREASAHAIAPDGTRWSDGGWVVPVFEVVPGGRPVARLARALPGPRDAGYGWIARHRSLVSKLVPARAKDRAQARIDAHAARTRPPVVV